MNMKYKIAVKGIIRREGGDILIVRRSEKDKFLPNIWETIGGEMTDSDKTPQEALKREMMEEAGLEVKVGEPFNVFTFINNEGEMKAGITFICDYLSGEVSLSAEHAEYAWVNAANFNDYESNESLYQEILNYANKFNNEHEKFSVGQKAVLIRDNKCLILEINNRPNVWDLPGGRINIGENKEAGLRREVKEELGITNFQIIGTTEYDAWYTSLGFAICGTASLITSEEEITLSNEHVKLTWITEDEINNYQYCWPKMSEMIKRGFELNKHQNK
jgi:8-oxo-dGTP diphosphatase